MTLTMTEQPQGRASRIERLQESVLAMLADSNRPLSTAELEAAHGMFLTGRVYTVLRALQDTGLIVRQRCLRVPPGRTVFWWLPGRAPGGCAIGGCPDAGTAFVPPRFDVKTSYITDQVSGIRSLLWRELVEIPSTGGWVCSNAEHRRLLLDPSSPPGRLRNGQHGKGES
jgi:hypothetical protein